MVTAIVNESSDSILQQVWNKCDDWTIEIDNRILNDSIINLTSNELTAMILHEIGHTVYSNSIPQRVSRVMKFEFAKTSLLIKRFTKAPIFNRLLSIPIIDSCSFRSPVNDSGIRNEIIADKFVVRLGYGSYLSSALKKLISTSNIDKRSSNDRMTELSVFSIETIQQLSDRNTALVKHNLNSMIDTTSATSLRNQLDKVYNSFFIRNDLNNKKSYFMSESSKIDALNDKVSAITDEFYDTEFFIFGKKKLKRIDPADIDYIDVQIANMKSNDDKMLLISYIYSKLDVINYYIDILNDKKSVKKYDVPHTLQQLTAMRDRLEKIRSIAISYKVPEIKYGINVNYPAGYLG